VRDIIKQKVLETKKSLVLEEISKIFENDGFSSVKMQDIANRLGISVGALYKLFSSKDDLSNILLIRLNSFIICW